MASLSFVTEADFITNWSNIHSGKVPFYSGMAKQIRKEPANGNETM